jgi:hypothetical protein
MAISVEGALNLHKRESAGTLSPWRRATDVEPSFPVIWLSLDPSSAPRAALPVRCCKNCTFYEVGAHWDCRETIPDPVFDKERSNFCDYFRLADRSGRTDASAGE